MLLRRCVRLLRRFSAAFQDRDWQPYVATEIEGVYAHRWHSGESTMHTLINETGAAVNGPVLQAPAISADGHPMRHYDLWNGAEIEAGAAGGCAPALNFHVQRRGRMYRLGARRR